MKFLSKKLHLLVLPENDIVGGEGSKHNIKPIGPVRGWTKTHPYANPNLTHRRSSRKADVKTMLVQAKHVNRGPMMGNG